MMKIIGITGGVASGKNFIANIFAKFGAEIFDADKVAHDLLKNDSDLISKLTNQYPTAYQNGEISRQILGEIVFNDAKKLQILEEIIHPKIRQQYQFFLQKNLENNIKIAVLNIPLLLEREGYEYDYLVAIKCDKELRRQRFLTRYLQQNSQENSKISSQFFKKNVIDNNSQEKILLRFEKINSLQIEDSKRLIKADFVIDNNLSQSEVESQIKDFITLIKNPHSSLSY